VGGNYFFDGDVIRLVMIVICSKGYQRIGRQWATKITTRPGFIRFF